MTVERPEMLLALLSLIAVGGLQVYAFILGRRDITRLAKQWPIESVTSVFVVKWFFQSAMFGVFAVLAILAAADITWGQEPIEEDRSGLDVVIVLDVSRSMLADDVVPNRLLRSVAAVRGVARQLAPSRIAVVVFKGQAATLMPLTEDVTAIEVALDNASPALVSAAGTDLSRGLEEAMARFPEGAAAHRAILLFSDGEALTGTLTSVLGRARREGIPILTVVAGTTLGAVVPSNDGSPMLDDDGRPVISRADSRTLGHVSETTGGTTHDLSDPNIVSELVDSLAQFADVRETEGFRLVPRRRYRLFLGLSLIALALSLSIRVVRWRDMF